MARVLLAAMLATGLAGCAEAAAGSGEAERVTVGITDSSFEMSAVKASDGTVTFVIENVGTMVHEFEVFAGATADQELPIVANTADTSGLRVVDEVEDIVPGAVIELTVELEPGTYLLLCNLPGHYAAGNWSSFVVTR
jgi:uncharacterized cupredoxin-like copper-binding protein